MVRLQSRDQFLGLRVAASQCGKQVLVLLGMMNPVQVRVDVADDHPKQVEVGFALVVADFRQEALEAQQRDAEVAVLRLDDGQRFHLNFPSRSVYVFRRGRQSSPGRFCLSTDGAYLMTKKGARRARPVTLSRAASSTKSRRLFLGKIVLLWLHPVGIAAGTR